MIARAPLIALVDWCRGGHNEMYLREYTSALTSLGCNVATLSSYHLPVDTPQTVSLDFSPRIRPLTSRSWKQPWEEYRLKWCLRRCLERAERHFLQPCEFVFFNCLYNGHARYVREAVSVLRQPWSGLFVQAKNFPLQNFPMPEKKAVLEEDVDGILFPDVTSIRVASSPLAQSLRNFAGDRPLVSLMGFLQPSKGIMPLISLSLRPELENVAFAFVGELCRANFSAEELSLIKNAESKSTNSYFHFQRLPDEEDYNAIIQASDVLYAAYIDFSHSSNMLTKAAVFEKPIIVSRGHLMASRVETYRIGEVVPQNNPSAVLNAIHTITDDCSFWASQKRPRWEEYRKRHSKDSLMHAFAEILDLYGIAHL